MMRMLGIALVAALAGALLPQGLPIAGAAEKRVFWKVVWVDCRP